MIPLHDDNPTKLTPYFTVGFIVASSLAFLWQLSASPSGQQAVAYGLGVVPAVLFGYRELPPEISVVPAPLTIVSSMFLHGGWMHLIGNMLYLWIFGNNVEDSMGHVRFVVFYLACGVAAVFAHALPNPDSTIPMIGASGAISGILGAYLLLYPHARVLVAIPVFVILYTVRLPAMGVLGFWFALQLVSSLFSDPTQPGVAFGAHIGGFLCGLALIPFFKSRNVRLLAPPRQRG
ncbi:MAG: rhomboid family intramembrane serine protease [Acidiferrobacterales bacterium]